LQCNTEYFYSVALFFPTALRSARRAVVKGLQFVSSFFFFRPLKVEEVADLLKGKESTVL
jgi:hypothetical protein